MRRQSRFAVLAITSVVALLSSCSSELQDTGESPATTSSTAPTTSDASPPSSVAVETQPSDEQQIEAQYKAAWEFLVNSGGLTDQQVLDGFSPYAVDPVLTQSVQVVSNLRAENKGPRGVVVFSPLTIVLDGDAATVTECRDGTTQLVVDLTTGETVSSGEPGHLLTATMMRGTDGIWKLSQYSAKPDGC